MKHRATAELLDILAALVTVGNQRLTLVRDRNGFLNASLLCQFATWTFRYHLRRFATWTLRTFRLFDTRTFRHFPGRFATSLKVCNLRYCHNFFVVRWRNVLLSWYRNVQRCETSRWRTGKVAKRPVTTEMSKTLLIVSGWSSERPHREFLSTNCGWTDVALAWNPALYSAYCSCNAGYLCGQKNVIKLFRQALKSLWRKT